MTPEFELCFEFYSKFDDLGSMTWDISRRKIVVLFYFNDENVVIEIMCEQLSDRAEELGLETSCLNFFVPNQSCG